MEYYILCPKRPDDEDGLITHLISRDICVKRQAEFFHKCPGCLLHDPSLTPSAGPTSTSTSARK
jgi:hypothetical protein